MFYSVEHGSWCQCWSVQTNQCSFIEDSSLLGNNFVDVVRDIADNRAICAVENIWIFCSHHKNIYIYII